MEPCGGYQTNLPRVWKAAVRPGAAGFEEDAEQHNLVGKADGKEKSMDEGLGRMLRRFNRRERQILFEWAYGSRLTGSHLREAMEDHLGLSEPIPDDAYVAVDYPLDWLVAALATFSESLYPGESLPPRWASLVAHSPEDVDLLISYRQGTLERLILAEAKAFTSWNGRQLRSKARRLKAIFGDGGDRITGVDPRWVMVAPKSSPPALNMTRWPTWMKVTSILQLPQPDLGRWGLQRWDATSKSPSAKGDALRLIAPTPWPSPYTHP